MLSPVRPAHTPTGLHLARTARIVGRAFDEALAAAGGSMPIWLVLLNVKTGGAAANQRELAQAVGIREATLTHHLNAIEAQGLVVRRRDPANRRIQTVELTPAGEAAFLRLRAVVVDFDHQLRTGFAAEDLTALERHLDHLAANATGASSAVTTTPGAPTDS
jgi:MarR family transcriptional regulator for hemolysin